MDELLFLAEATGSSEESENEPWRVLIDDDENVHLATQFAFKEFRFADKPIQFKSAYSAEQAKEFLARDAEIACVFLDVVMENDTAGLDLVGHIRQDLKNAVIRIILRTGQPGYAPEMSVIQGYDINDYKEKSQTTGEHLHTSLTSALRSYQQIVTIEENRRGLEMVIQASARLLSTRKVDAFATGMLTQISMLVDALPDGIVCVASSPDASDLKIIAATGTYAQQGRSVLDPKNEATLLNDLTEVLRSKASLFKSRISYIYIPVANLGEVVVAVNTTARIKELDRKLLELFSINIAVGFDNSRMYQEIERLAFIDQLTGLPNLITLFKHIGERLEIDGRYVLGLADIDNFEAVNDGLGREIGDKVIRRVAIDLLGIEEVSFVARVSGDVFGFLIAIDEPSRVAAALHKISQRMKKHISIENSLVAVSATIGATIFEGGANPNTIVSNAGIALKKAKQSRKGGYRLFEDDMNAELRTRLHVTARMHRALEEKAFFLMYQPQISLVTDKIIGVEALVRWRDGDRIIPPDQFINVAETSGLIIPLGKWVLETALRQQTLWRKAGLNLRMAVNVSTRQIVEDDRFVDYVRDAIRRQGGVPLDLELEVTESMIFSDMESGVARLLELQKFGVKIAIDDFGTGYSSLGQLRNLPINRLKIDRTFIRSIEKNDDDLHIAEMIVRMGHAIKLSALAEGVEESAHQDILKKLGCDEAQGYLYAKPLPPDEIVELCRGKGTAET